MIFFLYLLVHKIWIYTNTKIKNINTKLKCELSLNLQFYYIDADVVVGVVISSLSSDFTIFPKTYTKPGI